MSLNDLLDRCNDISAEIKQKLDALPQASDVQGELAKLAEMLNHYNNDFDQYKLDLYAAGDQEKKQHKPSKNQHQKSLKELGNRLAKANEAARRNKLMGNDRLAVDNKDNDALIANSIQTSKDSTASTLRTLQMVEQMNSLGRDTNQKLEKQSEQMLNTMEDLMEVESEMKRGQAIIKRMLRRTASDPVMWVLIFLVLVAIIVLIGMSIFGGDTTATDAVDTSGLLTYKGASLLFKRFGTV